MRIVSLLPSATEIVCALGRGGDLVGRSQECDFPPEVRALPVVMRAKTLDVGGPSSEIDSRVQEARGRKESLYTLGLELLRELRPDLLLTQDLCGVCSVTEAEVVDACRASGLAPAILSISPRTLDEVWGSVGTVGSEVGAAAAGQRLMAELQARTREPPSIPHTPRVAVVEWLDPPILAGLWTPDIIRRAGGSPVGPRSGSVGTRSSWTELESLAPDLIVVAPCSFDVKRTLRELVGTSLRAHLSAPSPRRGTWIADEAYFSRPGPRLAEGVELLRSLLLGSPPASSSRVVRWTQGIAA